MNVLTYVTYMHTYVERSIGMGHPVYWHTLEPIVPVKVASSLALLERKRIAWRRFYFAASIIRNTQSSSIILQKGGRTSYPSSFIYRIFPPSFRN